MLKVGGEVVFEGESQVAGQGDSGVVAALDSNGGPGGGGCLGSGEKGT